MSPTRTLRSGSKLGKYHLERQLGRGTFAVVWRAKDTVENRKVAVKIAHADLVKEWGQEAIEHEARIASQLSHPNIVSVRNADWIEGRFVLACDLAKESLATYAGARRSARIALEVIRGITAGLACAHTKNIIHRDVKPENILIFEDGRAALCDFGVSRFAKGASRTYTEAGTLGYMAPEQAYGKPRLTSDVFSLGLIGYQILTGVLPTWPFTWPPERHARFAERVPDPVQPVLRKAMTFEPKRRFPDAVAFHQALERAFRKVEETPQRKSPVRRRRVAHSPSPLSVEANLFRRRHGANLDMRFGCHRCDGPIAESMVYCPWCGSPDNSFRNITPYPLVCPSCERGVRAEWSYCPWCYAGRFESNGRAPRPDPRAERRCTQPGCDGELQPFMRYCPRCKKKPRRLWSHPELGDRCPRCRWPVSREFWRFCPWCGRREPRAGTFHKVGRS